MLYAVIYELKNKRKNYTNLFQKIKDYGTWMHYIDNVWIIESTNDANTIYNDIFPLIDQQKDYILVLKIASDYQGWLPKDAWDWMNKRLF